MPSTKSSKKRMRQNEKRNLRNRVRRSSLRTQIKRFRAAVDARNPEVAEREFHRVTKLLDKTAKHRVIHPNAASRKKSRLARLLNQCKAEHGGGAS